MKKQIAFALALVLLLILAACGTEPSPATPNAMIPMVMVDGVIYMTTGYESTVADRPDGFDGEITSSVAGSEMPTEQNQSNFGTGFGYQFGQTEGTVDVCIDGRWWIYATEEVRHRLQFPEQYMVVERPPDLIVNYGQQSIKADYCLTNWEYTMEDGTFSALMGDGFHPLEAKHISPFVTLDPDAPLEAWLYWEIMPDSLEVNCWDETCWENLESRPAESFRLMESNEVGDSYRLPLNDGEYIYEVIATWRNAPNFGGTVRYGFHTEK